MSGGAHERKKNVSKQANRNLNITKQDQSI